MVKADLGTQKKNKPADEYPGEKDGDYAERTIDG
jgi:hypothetical protein